MELEGFGVDFVDKRPMWAEAVRETAKNDVHGSIPGLPRKILFYAAQEHRAKTFAETTSAHLGSLFKQG
jgi:hypothetical protein